MKIAMKTLPTQSIQIKGAAQNMLAVRTVFCAAGFSVLFFLSQAVFAADFEATLTIKNHVFAPAVLDVPAGQRVKLSIVNEDATPEEFESHSLNREKVVQGNSKIVVFIGPLAAGKYDYFGEYNPKTAKGTIVAK